MILKRILSSHWFFIAVLLVLAYLTLNSIFQPGMFTGHDIWHQVARLYHFNNSLENGLIMPGWVSTLAFDHGYPLFFFSYHFPWILAMPLLWSGLSVFSALKLLFFIGYALAGLSMYFTCYWFTKNKVASLGAAIIYLISPAHFASVFVSASIGTVFQFVLYPLVLGLLTLLFVNKSYKAAILLGLVVAASILTHLMSFVFFVPVAGLYAGSVLLYFWFSEKQNRTRYLLYLFLAAVVALGVSAYYFFPMFELLPLVKAGQGMESFGEIYKGHFITFKQILYSRWGFGPIVFNAKDGEISFQLGIAQWLGVVASLAALSVFTVRKRLNNLSAAIFSFETRNIFIMMVLLVLFGLTVFLMLEPSKPIWDLVSEYFTLDYPHRFLVIAVVLVTISTGIALSFLKQTWLQVAAVCFLSVIAIYTNRNHMKPNMFVDFDLDTYVRSELTTNTFHEYLPVAAESSLLQKETDILAYDIYTQASLIDVTARGIIINVWTPKEVGFTVHQYDFPGQAAYVNGKKVAHEQGAGGLMFVSVPAGHSIIETKYEYPARYNTYLLITITTLLVSYYLIVKDTKG